jgi:hypothetical protein
LETLPLSPPPQWGDFFCLGKDRITQSVGGCAVNVTRYLVFFSQVQEGPYWFHGFTSDTTYTHGGVVTYAPAMFYNVIASPPPNPLAAHGGGSDSDSGKVLEILLGVATYEEPAILVAGCVAS